MSISAPTGVTSTTGSSSNLTLQDFLQVLLTQLTYQDPLKPMDNQQFMAQIAQFTTLQQTQDLNTNIQRMLTNQASLSSVGLIGRTVQFSTDSGTDNGTVTAVSLAGSSPLLTVQTTAGATMANIDLGQITTVR